MLTPYFNISMLGLNLTNIEELIFFDQKVRSLLPEFQSLFQQWQFSKIHDLRSIRQQCLLHFLNSINDDHLAVLKGYFGCDVTLTKINNQTVRNVVIPISDAKDKLHDIEGGYQDFAVFRDKDQLYISFWR